MKLGGDNVFALNADKNNNAGAISEFYSMGRRQIKASFVTVVLQAKLNAVPFVLLLVGSNHIRLLAFARNVFLVTILGNAVPDNKENAKLCLCPNCPVFKNYVLDQMYYCIKGKSSDIQS